MKTFRVYFAYFLQFFKGRLAYRWDFLVSIVGSALMTLSGLLFIIVLIDGKIIPSLAGWKREEVLLIYGYSMISMAIFSTLAPNLYQFADKYIIEGQFDRVLLRPVDSLSQVLFESFNIDAIGSLLLGLAVLFYSLSALGIELSAVDYLWLLISSASGGVILLSFFTILASLSFHFEDRIGIAPPFYNMIAFGRYPLPIFNDIIQFILRWIVPFAFVAFYPATHFLNRSGFETFCYATPVVAIVLVFLARLFWQLGVARYSSTGS